MSFTHSLCPRVYRKSLNFIVQGETVWMFLEGSHVFEHSWRRTEPRVQRYLSPRHQAYLKLFQNILQKKNVSINLCLSYISWFKIKTHKITIADEPKFRTYKCRINEVSCFNVHTRTIQCNSRLGVTQLGRSDRRRSCHGLL